MPAKKKKNNFNLLNSKVFLLAFFPAFLVVATSMILMGLNSINTFSTEAAPKRMIDITRMPSADGYYNEWGIFDSTTSTPAVEHYTFVDEFTCNGTDYVFSTSTTPENTDSYIINLEDIPDGSKIEKISIRPCTATMYTVNARYPDDTSGYYTTSSISFFYRYNGIDGSGKSYKVTNNKLLTPSPAIVTWSNVGFIKNASSTLEIGILHIGGSAGLQVSNLRTTISYR